MDDLDRQKKVEEIIIKVQNAINEGFVWGRSSRDKEVADLEEKVMYRNKLLHEFIECPIEDNPDEGPHCFYCWGSVDGNQVIDHDPRCVVVKVERMLQEDGG